MQGKRNNGVQKRQQEILVQKVKKANTTLQFQRLKMLKYIKNVIQKLPSGNEFKISEETEYLRLISSVIPLFDGVRLEQIPFIVTQQSFKRIVSQLIKHTQHKEIIISLLTLLVKGFPEYAKVIETTLFDSLEFMIQFQKMIVKEDSVSFQAMELNVLSKQVISFSLMSLIKQILKWYAASCVLAEKYGKLMSKVSSK